MKLILKGAFWLAFQNTVMFKERELALAFKLMLRGTVWITFDIILKGPVWLAFKLTLKGTVLLMLIL